MKLFETVDEFKYDNLFYDTKIPVATKGVTLAKDQGVLLRGTVLGQVTATGEYVPVDSAATDGSEKANCILADDVDTDVAESVVAVAYASGRFNRSALILGGTDTIDKHELRLRELSMYLKDKM